jgi:hypothetical protein
MASNYSDPRSSDNHYPTPEPGGFARGGLNPSDLSYMPPPRKDRPSRRMPILAGMLVLTCVAVPAIAYLRTASSPAPDAAASAAFAAAAAATVTPPPVVGVVAVASNPVGAQVFIDDEPRGVTPLRVTMPPGEYTLELRSGTVTRVLPLTVEANATVQPFVDLVPSLAASGRLEIISDPPGARVIVDGTSRGVTPLVLAAFPAGQHRVMVTDGTVTVNRTVSVIAGGAVSVNTMMTPSGSTGGWIAIKAPFEMQILDGGRLVGTTGSERIMLPVGAHTLDLVATPYQFKGQVTVQVQAGRTIDVPVTLPNGSLSISAVPWADVWLDGQPLGQTPLGHVAVPVGDHDILWKHPQLGERRQRVRVTTHTATRAGVDFGR